MFYVYFLGTRYGEYIEAATMLSAKWIFAYKHNINSINYIAAKKVK
jgi:hypothetical protein